MAIWRMRIACWIPKATQTHTHSEYVILIAFPLQLRLCECDLILRYTYIDCLVHINLCEITYFSGPLNLRLVDDLLYFVSRTSTENWDLRYSQCC